MFIKASPVKFPFSSKNKTFVGMEIGLLYALEIIFWIYAYLQIIYN